MQLHAARSKFTKSYLWGTSGACAYQFLPKGSHRLGLFCRPLPLTLGIEVVKPISVSDGNSCFNSWLLAQCPRYSPSRHWEEAHLNTVIIRFMRSFLLLRHSLLRVFSPKMLQ